MNLYAYVNQNPVNFVDPIGLIGAIPGGFGVGGSGANWLGGAGSVAYGGLSGVGSAIMNDPFTGGFVRGAAQKLGACGSSPLCTMVTTFVPVVRGGAVASGAPAVGQRVFRTWGDEAGAWGKSWTRTDPRSVAGYRDAAGLPGRNTGRFVSEGRLTNTEGVLQRRALPLEGKPGGLDEVVIPDPRRQIELERVSGVNPEF